MLSRQAPQPFERSLQCPRPGKKYARWQRRLRHVDDSAARFLAVHEGIEVHGSLGVVLWAAFTGLWDKGSCKVALDRLAASSLWLSPRVLREARKALAESTP